MEGANREEKERNLEKSFSKQESCCIERRQPRATQGASSMIFFINYNGENSNHLVDKLSRHQHKQVTKVNITSNEMLTLWKTLTVEKLKKGYIGTLCTTFATFLEFLHYFRMICIFLFFHKGRLLLPLW